jgi:choline kinase
MNVVILAAGQGRRLSPYTDACPKCLLPLGESTFIQFQIDLLRRMRLDSIAVITGFHAERVREVCGESVVYFHNAEYDTTNSLHSLMQAGDFARGGCLVLNSDVVLHPDLLEVLLSFPRPNALLVDFESALGEEEMKVVCDADGRVRRISKDIPPREAHGENLGVIRMGAEAAQAVLEEARAAAAAGTRNLWAPQGVARTLDRVPFHAVASGDRPWIEVDYLYDLERARSEIYPLCRLDGLQNNERQDRKRNAV